MLWYFYVALVATLLGTISADGLEVFVTYVRRFIFRATVFVFALSAFARPVNIPWD